MHYDKLRMSHVASSFNEAEARAPRMRGRSRRRDAEDSEASMRPRRVRLGCVSAWSMLTPHRLDASMRPRRARLGCDVDT